MRRFKEDDKNIVEYSAEEVATLPSSTDWARVNVLTDAEITAAALADSDTAAPEGTASDGAADAMHVFLGKGREALLQIMPENVVNEMLKPRGRPKATHPKELVSMRFSPEVLEFFRRQGKGWQTRMDTTLKEYVSQQSHM